MRREIGALREIHHPNVVEVFWAGQTSVGDWYLITEFIDGDSLDEFVTGKRNLRDREAADVALDVLDALVAFHPDSARLGLIHRDWDVSTDLFAVGVLLYQLLCNGNHPYPNAMPVVGAPVIDPRTIRSDLGAGLAEFLIKACAPASGDRFCTAAEMRLALRNVRAHL